MRKINEMKGFYHHQNFQIAKSVAIEILKNDNLNLTPFDKVDVLYYLANSRIEIYKKTKNKSELNEAYTDYATAWNVLHFVKFPQLQWLEFKIMNCKKEFVYGR